MRLIDDKLYRLYHDIKKRCTNPNSKAFKNYGGRGIRLEWSTFAEFEADMRPSYKEGLEIERIDNNGNYSKANCRWATRKEQTRNRRTNRLVTFRGLTKPLMQWIEELGLKSSTVRQRYYGYGWDIERCFTQPTQVHERRQLG